MKKNKLRLSLYLLVGLFLAFLVYIAIQLAADKPLAVEKTPPLADSWVEVKGIIHCHSTYSDGGGSVEQIAQVANQAGLDFLILTDHNTLLPLQEGKEKRYGRALILVSDEISTDAGHLLALRIKNPIPRQEKDAQKIIDLINRQKGFAIIAHPDNKKMPWKDWEVTGYRGMEIMNADSEWREEPSWSLLWSFFTYWLNPRYALLTLATNPKRNLVQWDLLNVNHKIVGIAGADAHAKIRITDKWGLPFPRYGDVFALGQMHLLLPQELKGDHETEKALIYTALEQGHGYLALDGLAPGEGFRFGGAKGSRQAIMGDELKWEPGWKLLVTVPRPRRARMVLRLIKDGQKILETKEAQLIFPVTQKGVYRVEVGLRTRVAPFGQVKERPWIFSNPIYFRG